MKFRRKRSVSSVFLRSLLVIVILFALGYGIMYLFNAFFGNKSKPSVEPDKDISKTLKSAEQNNKFDEKSENLLGKKAQDSIDPKNNTKNGLNGIDANQPSLAPNPQVQQGQAKPDKEKKLDAQAKPEEEKKQEEQIKTDTKPKPENNGQNEQIDSNVQKNKSNTDANLIHAQYNPDVAARFSYVKNEPNSIYVMLNKQNSLPDGFKTQDLVVPNIDFPFSHDTPKKYMRKEAADALSKLCAAAKKDGHVIYGISGYRSYDTQKKLYDMYVKRDGQESADKYSSKPGHSEHQSGLVMDVSSQAGAFDLQESFGDLPEGKWIAKNSHKYGFIVRYLPDKVDITGYAYEPWHLRYVGEDIATYMYENNLCLEEFYDVIGVSYNK